MAEEESSGERSEEASAHRLEEARKHGQIARSRDLAMTLSLMTGAGGLIFFSNNMAQALVHLASINLQFTRQDLLDEKVLPLHLAEALVVGGRLLFWPLLLIMLSGVAGSLLLGGFMFSTEMLLPKWERLNPWQGITRMFSLRSLLELFKALFKLLLVASCCLLILKSHRDEIVGMVDEPVPALFQHVAHLLLWSFFWMTSSLILVALMDVPAQWFSFMKELRMTHQEQREEYKETEGRPEVKARLRQMQRKMAEARMMSKIPEADVVITNPTHFAVALRYKPDKDRAPVLLAKGIDHRAMQIRKLAGEHKIVMVESPPLARSIYYTTDLDREIPTGLYQAVARILAWLHGVKMYQAGKAKHPGQVPPVDIPADLRHDRNAPGT